MTNLKLNFNQDARAKVNNVVGCRTGWVVTCFLFGHTCTDVRKHCTDILINYK